MTTNDIFKEVLKSHELKTKFNIPQDVLDKQTLDCQSDYPVIEIIRAIISGEENHIDPNLTFKNIVTKIMLLK